MSTKDFGCFLGRSYTTIFGWEIGSVSGTSEVDVTYNYFGYNKRVEIVCVSVYLGNGNSINFTPLLTQEKEDELAAVILQYEEEKKEE